MTANISHQIQELAKCGNQEILMYEAAAKHDIKSFSKVEDEYSFEFKTTDALVLDPWNEVEDEYSFEFKTTYSLESPHRYVFKRRLKTLNFQESLILITADFLDKELELYETRKNELHHHLVFMYDDCMLVFNMRDIRAWMMREGPTAKQARVSNKKCQGGSFTRCTEDVYYIPASVPRSCENYISNESFRASIYNRWTYQSDSSDAKPTKTQTPQGAPISPYF